MSSLVVITLVGAMVVVGGAAVLFERLSGQERGFSAFGTGAGNALAFWSASLVVELDKTVGIGMVTAFAVAAQFVVAAWTQRFRERRVYRAALTAENAPESIDPTATSTAA